MKARELRNLSEAALLARAGELLQEVSALRFGSSTKEKNVKKLLALRHERARVLTVLRERTNLEGGAS